MTRPHLTARGELVAVVLALLLGSVALYGLAVALFAIFGVSDVPA